MLKLSTDITARISTKFGLTRIVQVKGGVRQGGVLSAFEFSKIMDALERVLKELCQGVGYGSILLSFLLLMDDIIVLADDSNMLQKILDATFKFLCRPCI